MDGTPLFIADAGNLFFKRDKMVAGSQLEKAKITTDTIVRSFNIIGCDAFTPGSKDFAAGLDFLLGLEAKSDFPYISANIRDLSGRLLFQPYEIVSRGGVTVGFIGLTSIFTSEEVSIDDPVDALNAVVDEVALNSDFVVLLFHADEMDMKKIQNKDLPIDLIVQSKSRRRSMDGGTKVIPSFSCGDRGKYLYQFDIAITNPNKRLTDLSSQKKTIDTLNRKLASLRRNNARVQQGEQDPELQKVQAEIDEINRQKAAAEELIANASNFLNFKAHELGKTVVHRADILKIIDDNKALAVEVSSPKPAMPFTPAPEKPSSQRTGTH